MLGAVEKRLRGIILGWRAEHAELELSAPVLQTSLSHPLSAVLSLGMSCGWFAAAGNRLCAWPGVRTWRKEGLLLLSLLISPQGEPAALYEPSLLQGSGVSEHRALRVPSSLELPQMFGRFPWGDAHICCGCTMSEGSQHQPAMKLVTHESPLPAAGVLCNTGKSIYGTRQGCNSLS